MTRDPLAGTDWYSPLVQSSGYFTSSSPVSLAFASAPASDAVIVVVLFVHENLNFTVGGAGATWERVVTNVPSDTRYIRQEIWIGRTPSGSTPVLVTSPRVAVVGASVSARWFRHTTGVVYDVNALATFGGGSPVTTPQAVATGLDLHLHLLSQRESISVNASTIPSRTFAPSAAANWMKYESPNQPRSSGSNIGLGASVDWYFSEAIVTSTVSRAYSGSLGNGDARFTTNASLVLEMDPSRLVFAPVVMTSGMTFDFAEPPLTLSFSATSDISIFTTLAESVNMDPLAFGAESSGELDTVTSTFVDSDPLLMTATSSMEITTTFLYVWVFNFAAASSGDFAAVAGFTLGNGLQFTGTSDMQMPEDIFNSHNIILIFGPGGDISLSGVPAPTEPDWESLP